MGTGHLVIVKEDNAEAWDQYLLYLSRWIMDNHDIDCKGESPLLYDQWLECNE